jgi:murein DD-endopeptidase MepM/ murein hydrolase activator NlpD
MRLALPTLAVLALAFGATALPAHAADGTTGGADPGAGDPGAPSSQTGGARPGDPDSVRPRRRPRRRARPREDGRPLLRELSVGPARTYAYGTPARVRFRIDDRSRAVRVTIVVKRVGSRRVARRIELGDRTTGTTHDYRLPEGALPAGQLELRLAARDPAGNRLRAAARASAVRRIAFYTHRFPVLGSAWTYGGEGARFGSDRPGHVHQGQDLTAPEGTPLVAPRGGTVQVVAYQAGGAGHYVILDGDGEDRDYAFMHLQTGSIAVRQGQRVRTGELLGRVGSTGASSGPHLHFEIWEGGDWQNGGHPIDPLPHLRRWEGWS